MTAVQHLDEARRQLVQFVAKNGTGLDGAASLAMEADLKIRAAMLLAMKPEGETK